MVYTAWTPQSKHPPSRHWIDVEWPRCSFTQLHPTRAHIVKCQNSEKKLPGVPMLPRRHYFIYLFFMQNQLYTYTLQVAASSQSIFFQPLFCQSLQAHSSRTKPFRRLSFANWYINRNIINFGSWWILHGHSSLSKFVKILLGVQFLGELSFTLQNTNLYPAWALDLFPYWDKYKQKGNHQCLNSRLHESEKSFLVLIVREPLHLVGMSGIFFYVFFYFILHNPFFF